MATTINSAPVLFTPDDHILADVNPNQPSQTTVQLSEDDFRTRYEIERTLAEIRRNKWRRVALQFPDDLLPHSARVFQSLSRETSRNEASTNRTVEEREHGSEEELTLEKNAEQPPAPTNFTILADTSYGSCCVDEIAAEHINADAVVHYGRACLSPTARLPVLHVFTSMPLDLNQAKQAFITAFPNLNIHVIVTADIPYALHIEPLCQALTDSGYVNLFPATIAYDSSSAIPNRKLPTSVANDPSSLSSWHIFHVAEPPTALLLTLSSRVASIQVFAVDSTGATRQSNSIEANIALLLRRRYALVTSMSTVSTWGILINTLSVKNYLHVMEHVKQLITNADKKFYLFVVGKINAAKVANFSEIGGWVVIGCWESSLIDSKDFFRPMLTPFELELALMRDEDRVWSGAWTSNFQELLDRERNSTGVSNMAGNGSDESDVNNRNGEDSELDLDSEDESAPPEFDLRTGKLISRSRPKGSTRQYDEKRQTQYETVSTTTTLARRAKGDIVAVNGVASPAGEYLREKRTWKGLGSDFEIRYEDDANVEGSLIEQGRRGVAGGYSVGDSSKR